MASTARDASVLWLRAQRTAASRGPTWKHQPCSQRAATLPEIAGRCRRRVAGDDTGECSWPDSAGWVGRCAGVVDGHSLGAANDGRLARASDVAEARLQSLQQADDVRRAGRDDAWPVGEARFRAATPQPWSGPLRVQPNWARQPGRALRWSRIEILDGEEASEPSSATQCLRCRGNSSSGHARVPCATPESVALRHQ